MAKKQQLSCNADFLGLEFDTLLMEVQLPKDKLKKAMEGVANVLEKKSLTTNEEIRSLVSFLFLRLTLSVRVKHFSNVSMTD